MNKFRKGLLAMSIAALTLGGLTACNQTSAELQQAQTFLYQAYKDEIVNTDDYKIYAHMLEAKQASIIKYDQLSDILQSVKNVSADG